MNQVNRLLGQVVLPNHARDLDLTDRVQTHRRLQSQTGIANQLPAHSAGNFHQQLRKLVAGLDACVSHAQPSSAETRAGQACCPARQQKENQCQES